MDAAADASVGVISASFLLGALTLKLVDFFKYLRNSDWNGILSIALSWGAGIVAVWVFSKSQWGDEVKIGNESLDSLGDFSTILLGLIVPSIASVLYDAKKAIDRTDSASTPRLTPTAERERKARLKSVFPGTAAAVGAEGDSGR
jgi:cobalamin synthase